MALRIAVLIKQVPSFETMRLGADGRLARDGLEPEMNPYCRRAVSKGVELAREWGGRCTAVTLGPPSAEDSLREAVAWGADDALLVTDPAFGGSDTLATARAIAAALALEGPWDLILCGRNSVDADTGQVGPELAELLELPFLAGVKELSLGGPDGREVHTRCEHDDGWLEAETTLPALLSCAERLCEPAKVDRAGRDAVSADRIRTIGAAQLGNGPWGQAGSPTTVGEIRVLEAVRAAEVLSGPLADQVRAAVESLADAGALAFAVPSFAARVSAGVAAAPGALADRVAGPGGPFGDGPVVAVVLEPDRSRVARELLGAAAGLAAQVRGHVVAIGAREAIGALPTARSWGADAAVVLSGSTVEEDVARAVGHWCALAKPWALLTAGTMWGREVAARIAARLGAGLTGDAVDLGVREGRLVGWKPAFGGQLVAAITASSPLQMATVRPGMLPLPTPRGTEHGALPVDGLPVDALPVDALPVDALPVAALPVAAAGRVRHRASGRDDELDELMRADSVVGIGTGVHPDEYPRLRPLLDALGAELGATRKVTDKGWLPRARQIGITGRSIAPRLYVAIGLGGKFNHMVGVRGAGRILAINAEPDALVFSSSDLGIVGDWRDVVPLLVDAIHEHAAVSGDALTR